MNEETGWSIEFGTNDLKRFFQWILGCTYTKKTVKTRIAEMFQFAEAPHIIVYERSEGKPWWWTVAIIVTVLVGVLSLYYSVEAIYRRARRFFVAVLHEPQSTVTTPRCLSPVKEDRVRRATPEATIRQKVPMNEPVNCVFVRPMSPKIRATAPSPMSAVPALNSQDEDVPESAQRGKKKKSSPATPPLLEEVQFDASSNVNIRPTPSAHVFTSSTQPSTPRKPTGGDDLSSWASESAEEWIQQQVSGCQKLETERSEAGNEGPIVSESEGHHESKLVSADFVARIQNLIEEHLNETTSSSSGSNISEMSPVSTESSTQQDFDSIRSSSIFSSLIEKDAANMPICGEIGRETSGDEEEADIIIDDSPLLAESDTACSGSILLKNGTQRVLFRWTDDSPATVDSVSVTGSFFGWNMHIPMRRSGENTFQVCVELAEGMHDYTISIFRFD